MRSPPIQCRKPRIIFMVQFNLDVLGFDSRLVLCVRLKISQHVAHALDGLLGNGIRGEGDIRPFVMQ